MNEVKKHDVAMKGDVDAMSDLELNDSVVAMMTRYIPNLVATFGHPFVIAAYRERLVALMSEVTRRETAKIASLKADGIAGVAR